MDSWTYRHLLAQLNKSCAIPHHYFPSHNLLSLDTLLEVSQNLKGDLHDDDGSEFLSRFPCYQSFPYAVQRSTVLFCGSRVVDDATMLVNKKLNWERKLKRLRIPSVEIAIQQIRKMRQNKTVKLSKNMKKYIKHFHHDPAPNFSGSYNWLYTGGCLDFDEGHDGITLIAGDFFGNQPGFHLLKLNESLDEIQYTSFANLKAFSPVLQIACKAKEENLIIGARQKNFVNLFSVNKKFSDSHPVKLWRKKVAPSKLITCIDLKDSCEEIVITDSSYDLHLFDIEKRVKVFGHSGKRIAPDCNRSCWSQVAIAELGIYWAFKNCFVIMDQRDSNPIKLEYMPAEATDICEEISCFLKSTKDPNYMYLGTTHSVLQIDLRKGETVQKWTHLMMNPPQFMTSVEVDEKTEVLLLQSKTVDEIIGIVNKCSDDGGGQVHFVSTSLPCLLNNIKESFNLARFHGVCLSPVITKRIDFAVTGMHCLKNDQNDIILFTTNSGGDVFQSQIKKETSGETAADEDNEEVLKTMRMYEAHCEKFGVGHSTNRHLDVIDMRHIHKVLEKTPAKVKHKKNPEVYWRYREMYAPESLTCFKDFLAQKILNVWGHPCEEPEEPGETEETELEEPKWEDMSVDSKVREWMDKF